MFDRGRPLAEENTAPCWEKVRRSSSHHWPFAALISAGYRPRRCKRTGTARGEQSVGNLEKGLKMRESRLDRIGLMGCVPERPERSEDREFLRLVEAGRMERGDDPTRRLIVGSRNSRLRACPPPTSTFCDCILRSQQPQGIGQTGGLEADMNKLKDLEAILTDTGTKG